MELTLHTASAEETFALGRSLGECLLRGDLLGLRGELGAGKTQLVRGLAAGLAIDPDVIYSPTFTLVAEHEGRLKLHHIDLFRLGERVASADEEAIGIADYLDPAGVTAIEWYEKLNVDAKTWTLEIRIDLGKGDRRTIHLAAPGRRGSDIIATLRDFVPS